jgi:lincosamide nucleotidyltransferase A/C/D/E
MVYDMSAASVVELLKLLDQEGIFAWVDGGWAVDALLGEQTRLHNDLDLVVEEKSLVKLQSLLESQGYDIQVDENTTPWNFVLGNSDGCLIDLHVIALDSVGNGIYGPPEKDTHYPADSLTGRGIILGYPVRCISPEWLVRFHTGYEFDEQDVKDVLALHRRFGVHLPPEYKPYA